MERDKAILVKVLTEEERKKLRLHYRDVKVVRIRDHERLLYFIKDKTKPFVMPRPYSRVVPKPTSDKYDKRKAWENCTRDLSRVEKYPRYCARCKGRKDHWVGVSYKACVECSKITFCDEVCKDESSQ